MLSAAGRPPLTNDTLPYFAYGANMSGLTLQKRGVSPITVEPARAPTSLSLAFAHRGGYATLMEGPLGRDSTDPASGGPSFPGPYGLLYTLSSTDFRQIVSRETGYQVISLGVRTSSGEQMTARAFQSQRLLRLRRSLPPRQQYLDLMLSAAREHGLCEEYCQWLEAVPSVDKGTPLGPEYFETESEALARIAAVSLAIAGGVWAAGHGSVP